MVPDAREGLEIAALVLGRAVGAEEADGLAREGFHADQVAGGAVRDARPGLVVRADGHAEACDLDLALIDGGQGARCAEERDDVCTACNAAEVYGVWEGFVDKFEGAGC